MKRIRQEFTVRFRYDVEFTEGLFERDNDIFANQIKADPDKPIPKVLFVLDEGMYDHHPDLFSRILRYSSDHGSHFEVIGTPVILPGGEAVKNNPDFVEMLLDGIERHGIDRHSYIAVIGGGAVIDIAGYTAAIAHRGIRLIRIPTTVLAQNDAAVGVKNGINTFGKKNFQGTFDPPHAVLNDFNYLKTLTERDWRSGISEAVKVALIKDPGFFYQLEKQVSLLKNRDMNAMKSLIHRCAELHLEHISTSGDPFEKGSSRPLDFGHWAAHKIEQLSNYELRHGEAVAIGISLDVTYSYLKGMITEDNWRRILNLFIHCGFQLFVPELEYDLDQPEKKNSILQGLEEFREHLGGVLTIVLIEGIGKGVEVNEIDRSLYKEAVSILRSFEQEPV